MMSKKIFFLLICVVTALYADSVLDKKLELLEMMRSDGVDNIYTTYASLMEKKDKQKSKELLIKGVENQEYKAMRILGFKLFEENEKEEALFLLCKVAMLGDESVVRDIYLMPILFDVKKSTLESACEKASKELYSKEFKTKAYEEKYNMFEDERRSKGFTYYRYFDFLTSKIENLTEDEYRKFLSDADKKNHPRVKKHKRLAKEKSKYYDSLDWEFLKKVDRKNEKEKAISNIFALSRDDDLKSVEDKLKEKLRAFNALRSKNKTLTFDELLNLIGKK